MWSSLVVLPSFLFFQQYPSLRYLTFFLLYNNMEPLLGLKQKQRHRSFQPLWNNVEVIIGSPRTWSWENWCSFRNRTKRRNWMPLMWKIIINPIFLYPSKCFPRLDPQKSGNLDRSLSSKSSVKKSRVSRRVRSNIGPYFCLNWSLTGVFTVGVIFSNTSRSKILRRSSVNNNKTSGVEPIKKLPAPRTYTKECKYIHANICWLGKQMPPFEVCIFHFVTIRLHKYARNLWKYAERSVGREIIPSWTSRFAFYVPCG